MPKEAPNTVQGVTIDPGKFYKIQLGKYVPDYLGSPMTKLQPYHLTGQAVLDINALDAGNIASVEVETDRVPDAQKPVTLDPPQTIISDLRDPRKPKNKTINATDHRNVVDTPTVPHV